MNFKQWRLQDSSEGSAPTSEQGHLPVIRQNVCQALHENERNWTEGAVSVAPPSGSTNVKSFHLHSKLKQIDNRVFTHIFECFL